MLRFFTAFFLVITGLIEFIEALT